MQILRSTRLQKGCQARKLKYKKPDPGKHFWSFFLKSRKIQLNLKEIYIWNWFSIDVCTVGKKKLSMKWYPTILKQPLPSHDKNSKPPPITKNFENSTTLSFIKGVQL